MAYHKSDKKEESIDKKIMKFKRKNSDKLAELRKHEFAMGKSEKEKRKRLEAAKKRRKDKKGGNSNGGKYGS